MKFILIYICLLVSSCAILPDGTNVLEERIVKASKEINKSNFDKVETTEQGRPIYIEAVTYPQMIEGGHVMMKGQMALLVGREKISINNILNIETNPIKEELSQEEQEDLKIVMK